MFYLNFSMRLLLCMELLFIASQHETSHKYSTHFGVSVQSVIRTAIRIVPAQKKKKQADLMSPLKCYNIKLSIPVDNHLFANVQA